MPTSPDNTPTSPALEPVLSPVTACRGRPPVSPGVYISKGESAPASRSWVVGGRLVEFPPALGFAPAPRRPPTAPFAGPPSRGSPVPGRGRAVLVGTSAGYATYVMEGGPAGTRAGRQ